MNWLGILPVLIGVSYLIYSILYRDKVTYYNKKFSKKTEMTIIKPSAFFRLQLKFAILNSIYLIIIGIVITIFNIHNVFIILGFTVFYLINFVLMVKSKMKGYIYYK